MLSHQFIYLFIWWFFNTINFLSFHTFICFSILFIYFFFFYCKRIFFFDFQFLIFLSCVCSLRFDELFLCLFLFIFLLLFDQPSIAPSNKIHRCIEPINSLFDQFGNKNCIFGCETNRWHIDSFHHKISIFK